LQDTNKLYQIFSSMNTLVFFLHHFFIVTTYKLSVIVACAIDLIYTLNV